MWEKGEKYLSKDKYIGPLIKKYGPCKIRPSKKKDYFLDLVDAIVSQQLSGKVAKTIFQRVKLGLKEVTPKNILKTPDSKFRKWGLSRQKISYVKDLADKVLKKEVKIDKLDKLPDEEVARELILVKGIGRWTAEMFLMFSLARPDVFPIDDLGIQKGITKLLKRRVSSQKIGKFAERWKPYRSLAAWYIWEIVDN
ncbi:MAG: DNA-3-methyladenine glycosylase family protein [Patescibacteria group bacterium]